MTTNIEKFDYVVIGAGTAGSLLANRLSANVNNNVLLLEAGKADNYPWIHIPVGYLYCIGNPRTDWMYETEPDKGLNERVLRYPRGKALGGCSSINGMIYMRGQARDYDNWAKLTGEDGWNWEHSLADFKRHENHYKLDNGSSPENRFQTSTDMAVNGGLKSNACAGTCSTALSRRPVKMASSLPMTSMKVTTAALAILKSIRNPDGAGTHQRPLSALPKHART